MKTIPLSALPAQTFRVALDDQYCTISLYQRENRLYLDLFEGDNPVCTGVVCQEGVDVIQSKSPYFSGSLHFLDLQGASAPRWESLGSRHILLYCAAGETLPRRLRY